MNRLGPVYSRKVSSVRSRQALGVGRQKGGTIFSTVKRRRRRPSKVQELQLSSTDNNNLARTADDTDTMIAPVNNFSHSIFKQINMRLNRTLISEQTDTYHYKAYMETLLHNNRQRR